MSMLQIVCKSTTENLKWTTFWKCMNNFPENARWSQLGCMRRIIKLSFRYRCNPFRFGISPKIGLWKDKQCLVYLRCNILRSDIWQYFVPMNCNSARTEFSVFSVLWWFHMFLSLKSSREMNVSERMLGSRIALRPAVHPYGNDYITLKFPLHLTKFHLQESNVPATMDKFIF